MADPPVEAGLRNFMMLPAARDVPVLAFARKTTPCSISSVAFCSFSFTGVVWSVLCFDWKCSLMLLDENVWLELIVLLHTLHMNCGFSLSSFVAAIVVQSEVLAREPGTWVLERRFSCWFFCFLMGSSAVVSTSSFSSVGESVAGSGVLRFGMLLKPKQWQASTYCVSKRRSAPPSFTEGISVYRKTTCNQKFTKGP